MKWWKRGLFSAISLIGGFFSLDYQILAFGMLIRNKEHQNLGDFGGLLWQMAGAGMFLLYAAALAGYFILIRKNTSVLPAYQNGERVKKWKGARMELLLQSCFLLTGLVFRFGYLLYIYLPSQLI